MSYHEVFEAGNQRQGSYRCRVHITDPAGFTLGPGAGDAPYAAPAAREHGQDYLDNELDIIIERYWFQFA